MYAHIRTERVTASAATAVRVLRNFIGRVESTGGEWTPVTLRRDRMQRYAVREGGGAVKIHRLLSKIALIPRGGRARVTNIPSRKPTAVPRSRQWFRDADSAGIITHALRKRARPFIFQRRFIVFAP